MTAKPQPLNSKNQDDKVRTRRNAFLLGVVLLLVVCVMGNLALRSFQARTGAYNNEPDRPWENPAKEKVLRDTRIAKAKRLRGFYRSWALQHKDVLQRLLHAKADDNAAMMAAWNAIPSDPTAADAPFPHGEAGRDEPAFSWWPGTAWYVANFPPKTSKGKENIKKMQLHGDKKRAETFASHRDFIISDSSHAGPAKVALWASGRITEEKIIESSSGPTAFADAPSEELVPPYDFLK